MTNEWKRVLPATSTVSPPFTDAKGKLLSIQDKPAARQRLGGDTSGTGRKGSSSNVTAMVVHNGHLSVKVKKQQTIKSGSSSRRENVQRLSGENQRLKRLVKLLFGQNRAHADARAQLYRDLQRSNREVLSLIDEVGACEARVHGLHQKLQQATEIGAMAREEAYSWRLWATANARLLKHRHKATLSSSAVAAKPASWLSGGWPDRRRRKLLRRRAERIRGVILSETETSAADELVGGVGNDSQLTGGNSGGKSSDGDDLKEKTAVMLGPNSVPDVATTSSIPATNEALTRSPVKQDANAQNIDGNVRSTEALTTSVEKKVEQQHLAEERHIDNRAGSVGATIGNRHGDQGTAGFIEPVAEKTSSDGETDGSSSRTGSGGVSTIGLKGNGSCVGRSQESRGVDGSEIGGEGSGSGSIDSASNGIDHDTKGERKNRNQADMAMGTVAAGRLLRRNEQQEVAPSAAAPSNPAFGGKQREEDCVGNKTSYPSLGTLQSDTDKHHATDDTYGEAALSDKKLVLTVTPINRVDSTTFDSSKKTLSSPSVDSLTLAKKAAGELSGAEDPSTSHQSKPSIINKTVAAEEISASASRDRPEEKKGWLDAPCGNVGAGDGANMTSVAACMREHRKRQSPLVCASKAVDGRAQSGHTEKATSGCPPPPSWCQQDLLGLGHLQSMAVYEDPSKGTSTSSTSSNSMGSASVLKDVEAPALSSCGWMGQRTALWANRRAGRRQQVAPYYKRKGNEKKSPRDSKSTAPTGGRGGSSDTKNNNLRKQATKIISTEKTKPKIPRAIVLKPLSKSRADLRLAAMVLPSLRSSDTHLLSSSRNRLPRYRSPKWVLNAKRASETRTHRLRPARKVRSGADNRAQPARPKKPDQVVKPTCDTDRALSISAPPSTSESQPDENTATSGCLDPTTLSTDAFETCLPVTAEEEQWLQEGKASPASNNSIIALNTPPEPHQSTVSSELDIASTSVLSPLRWGAEISGADDEDITDQSLWNWLADVLKNDGENSSSDGKQMLVAGLKDVDTGNGLAVEGSGRAILSERALYARLTPRF